MSWFAKFGLAVFAAVIIALFVVSAGFGLHIPALIFVGLGFLALPFLACIVVLVANEVYEVRNDIPFQW